MAKKKIKEVEAAVLDAPVRTCRVCGCTDNDCSQCIEKTGKPCYWVEDDLCSACQEETVFRNSASSASLRMIAVDIITPDPRQPRKFFDQAAQDELTESIRANGILQPILVRPDDTEEEAYLLVCGERRLRSAKEAGLLEIPAVIRQMGDAEALELQIVENLQRKDVRPMEEAVGFKSLHERGMSVEDIAMRVGKSPAFVAQRLKLNDLIPDFQEMLARELINLTEAYLMARIAPESQEEILRAVADGKKDWRQREGWRPYNISQYVNRNRLSLKKPGFNPQDPAVYPKAGPCTSCPHNSANSPLLFPDAEEAVCANSVCYHIKQENAYKQKIEKFISDPEMLFIHNEYYLNGQDRMKVKQIEDAGLKVIGHDAWYKATPEQKKEGVSRKAFVVCGSGEGKLIDVVLKSNKKAADIKKTSNPDDVQSEIDRIRVREERNIQLDGEKIWKGIRELLDNEEKRKLIFIKEPLTSIEMYGMARAIENKLTYPRRDWAEELLGEDEELTEEKAVQHLNAMMRMLTMDAIASTYGSYLDEDDNNIAYRILKQYLPQEIAQIELDQQSVADARADRVKKRIEALKKLKAELKKAQPKTNTDSKPKAKAKKKK